MRTLFQLAQRMRKLARQAIAKRSAAAMAHGFLRFMVRFKTSSLGTRFVAIYAFEMPCNASP